MARAARSVEVAALLTAVLDALEAANKTFDRDIAEDGMGPICEGIVDWIRAREDDDLEVDLSDVTVSGSDLIGTGSIT